MVRTGAAADPVGCQNSIGTLDQRVRGGGAVRYWRCPRSLPKCGPSREATAEDVAEVPGRASRPRPGWAWRSRQGWGPELRRLPCRNERTELAGRDRTIRPDDWVGVFARRAHGRLSCRSVPRVALDSGSLGWLGGGRPRPMVTLHQLPAGRARRNEHGGPQGLPGRPGVEVAPGASRRSWDRVLSGHDIPPGS